MGKHALNYEKKSYIHNKSGYASNQYLKTLKSQPTQNQIEYCKFLLKLCEKYNVTGCKPSIADDRCSVGKAINTMKTNLIAAGIDVTQEHTQKRKFRFDKDGNVVEIATGKIVRKRT